MPRAEMLSRLSSRELSEWMIYYGLEPFGSEAPYISGAITASTIANVNRKKGTKPIKPEDMMPKFERPKEQTTEEMIGVARMVTAAMGGKVEA